MFIRLFGGVMSYCEHSFVANDGMGNMKMSIRPTNEKQNTKKNQKKKQKEKMNRYANNRTVCKQYLKKKKQEIWRNVFICLLYFYSFHVVTRPL